MAIVSMPFSVPSLNYPKKTLGFLHRRSNRGVAFASLGKEITTPGVKVIEGEGNLPKVVLTTSHGSEAEMYLFGACVTSWKIPSGKDLLFVRPDAVFNKKKPIRLFSLSTFCLDLVFICGICKGASLDRVHLFCTFPYRKSKVTWLNNCWFLLIVLDLAALLCIYCLVISNWLDTDKIFMNSGGIPHCFPQFGPGEMQQHGFARNLDWSIVDTQNHDGNPVVTVELKDNPYSRAMWEFSFQAMYKVMLQEKSLLTELTISNTDNKPFSFSAALHTYFRATVTGASVKDLSGCKTLDKHPDPNNPKEGKEEREAVPFPRFVDCIYRNAPNLLRLHNGLSDVIIISNTNWPDAVLWNPYEQMEACYREFVCVENAQIEKVQVEPGKSWTAKQCLSVK
ncbi:hypothetical protein ACFE04_023400 [Oxalis oulophora]